MYHSPASTAVSMQSVSVRRHREQEVKPLLLSSQLVVLSKPCGLDTYLPAELYCETGTSVSTPMAQTLLTQLEQQVCNTHKVSDSSTDKLTPH